MLVWHYQHAPWCAFWEICYWRDWYWIFERLTSSQVSKCNFKYGSWNRGISCPGSLYNTWKDMSCLRTQVNLIQRWLLRPRPRHWLHRLDVPLQPQGPLAFSLRNAWNLHFKMLSNTLFRELRYHPAWKIKIQHLLLPLLSGNGTLLIWGMFQDQFLVLLLKQVHWVEMTSRFTR